jgi:archaemetzincin
MQSIMVVPIVPAPLENLGGVLQHLAERFRLPVKLVTDHGIDPAPAYDASRNQYYSSLLLAALLATFPRHRGKILAVTGSDLFIPVLTYVFGEAQLDGIAALVSSFRFDERFYGMPENKALFEKRLIKEAVHELGHTFGLVHCRRFDCVMHSSTAVEEIDVKSENFCAECDGQLQSSIAAMA